MSDSPSDPSLRSTEPRSSRVGLVLDGKYELLRKLGEGGMGEVYEAVHTFVGRPLAVKFLHPDLAQHPEIVSRFRREAQSAGALQSENIVAIVDYGTTADGAPYIVMEYLEGEDCNSLLTREGPLPVPRAVGMIIQACRGLAVAHARNIVHRDLKPENLFRCQRGDGADLIKILDFGIAKLKGATTSGARTEAGALIGTLLYMPPEQVRGDADIDARADIYALGAILYQALSGRVPFPGAEPHTIIYRIMNTRPPPLAELRAGLPPGLADVVHRALAFTRSDRPADVMEFAATLAPFAGPYAAAFAPPSGGTETAASGRVALGGPQAKAARTTAPTFSHSEPQASAPARRGAARTATIGGSLVVAAAAIWLIAASRTQQVHNDGDPGSAGSQEAASPGVALSAAAPVSFVVPSSAPASTAPPPAPSALRPIVQPAAVEPTAQPSPGVAAVASKTGTPAAAPPQKVATSPAVKSTVETPTSTPKARSEATPDPVSPPSNRIRLKRGSRDIEFDGTSPYR